MAADKTEHFEVWYSEESGKERHQKAENLDQAVEIAADHTYAGFNNVTIHKVTTSSTVVDVDIPSPVADSEPV